MGRRERGSFLWLGSLFRITVINTRVGRGIRIRIDCTVVPATTERDCRSAGPEEERKRKKGNINKTMSGFDNKCERRTIKMQQ